MILIFISILFFFHEFQQFSIECFSFKLLKNRFQFWELII